MRTTSISNPPNPISYAWDFIHDRDRSNNNLEKVSHHPSNVPCRHCNNCQLVPGKECTPDLPDAPTKFATTQLEAQVHTLHTRSKKIRP